MRTNLSETVPLEGLVSRETQKRLERLVSLVLKWNPKINLISPSDEARVWTRHVNDSLTLVALLPNTVTRVIDFGSGGGFPGLVIAAVTGAVVELVEADRRKAVFLTEAAREMGVSVLVHATRIENVQLSPSSIITARALAPLTKLLAYARPLLTFDGTCLFSKGPHPEYEIVAARKTWRFNEDITQTPVGTIISIRNVERI